MHKRLKMSFHKFMHERLKKFKAEEVIACVKG